MYKSTVESDSTHRRWLPGRKDHGDLFVDLSAVYDTVNHRLLIQKLDNTTQDSILCRVIQNLLCNRRFYVELNKERIRWRKQKNGSVLAPTFSTFTPTTSRSMEPGASSTQTFYVSRPSTNHSSRVKRQLKRHWIT